MPLILCVKACLGRSHRPCASAPAHVARLSGRPLSCLLLACFVAAAYRRGKASTHENAHCHASSCRLAQSFLLPWVRRPPRRWATRSCWRRTGRSTISSYPSRMAAGSIEAVRGRILYDFSGNACDGYALQFRQVSELDSGEGKAALSDLRSTTWEDAAAKTFRFNSENLRQRAADRRGRRPCRAQRPSGGRQPEQAEGEAIHRAGRRRVSDRAHAPHHRGGARRQDASSSFRSMTARKAATSSTTRSR